MGLASDAKVKSLSWSFPTGSDSSPFLTFVSICGSSLSLGPQSTLEALCFEKALGRDDCRANDVGNGSLCHGRKDEESCPPPPPTIQSLISPYTMVQRPQSLGELIENQARPAPVKRGQVQAGRWHLSQVCHGPMA